MPVFSYFCVLHTKIRKQLYPDISDAERVFETFRTYYIASFSFVATNCCILLSLIPILILLKSQKYRDNFTFTFVLRVY